MESEIIATVPVDEVDGVSARLRLPVGLLQPRLDFRGVDVEDGTSDVEDVFRLRVVELLIVGWFAFSADRCEMSEEPIAEMPTLAHDPVREVVVQAHVPSIQSVVLRPPDQRPVGARQPRSQDIFVDLTFLEADQHHANRHVLPVYDEPAWLQGLELR